MLVTYHGLKMCSYPGVSYWDHSLLRVQFGVLVPSADFLDLWASSSLVFSGDVSPSFSRGFLCVIQHRNRPTLRVGRPRPKRTPPMPVPMGSVQAQILMKLSRASVVVSRSGLVEPCAATCFVRGMVGRCSKMLRTYQVR